MQRFRSFRESFRRKKDKITQCNHVNSKVSQWHTDEIAVRQGSCKFPIKYIGCVEVFESRGMPICEEALKVLRGTKRKSIRGTLFVSGDGLRVVDGDTCGLIVDQTIEKVSFCSPDRNNERGFAYICRDGTTRRWMCHGFHAIGNTGERLSHAVGCAFAICLERKQKREREAISTHNNQLQQAQQQQAQHHQLQQQQQQLQQHKIQPQQVLQRPETKIQKSPEVFRSPEPPPMKPVINPYAIDRPHATPLMLQRQTSFRQLSHLRSQTPFKRQLSLKLQQFERAHQTTGTGETSLHAPFNSSSSSNNNNLINNDSSSQDA